MKLNIKNFAKIEEADILIDGITVIAGENNTGKSTIGKILFALFNSLSDIEEKIKNQRLKEIKSIIKIVLVNNTGLTDKTKSLTLRRLRNTITNKITDGIEEILDDDSDIKMQSIRKIVESAVNVFVREYFDEDKETELQFISDEILEKIAEVLIMPENVLALEAISRYFESVFYGQINSLTGNVDKEAVLSLEIKGKKNTLSFENNICDYFDGEIFITKKAVYIDNPFVIDELSEYNDLNVMQEMLKKLLTNESTNDLLDGIIESVRAKEKLSDVYKTLQTVVDGDIIAEKNDELYLKNDSVAKPISVHNLSTGVKSFVILKMLIERGGLQEKDVLILDEPEIHLHPEWQVAYAEFIVLLQKHFDLSIVVTTHSPYFMDAIDLFSHKYKINEKVNYYLSSIEDDKIHMNRVTDNIDLIYKKMASPIQELDSLRYELNNEG